LFVFALHKDAENVLVPNQRTHGHI